MLKEILDKLPPSERKMALYILDHPNDSIRYTANELGKLSQTSSAAVIRLCKSLGLSGFQELKLRIASDLQKSTDVGCRDIEPNESHESIVRKMTSNNLQAIKETSEILNDEVLRDAVAAIQNAGTIHLFGVGASGVIAQDAQQKLMRINKSAVALTDMHMVAMNIANVKQGDVVFGISFSGETEEVVKILELAKHRRAITMSLTSYGTTPVSKIADINLYISASQEAVFRSAATSSRLAQLHLIDILFMCVVTNQYEDSVRRLDEARIAVNFLKQT
ncbi:MurR/RpiR family transcriptional regulator [Tuberibacillus sp. Marseille-P3662]|uniref:MurR/RpiR family transcriptional regulator n=1 Tax=Tuberibacillus sp. Marseille-P3662 TaxID=1965358 RepID=UPI000A1CA366|nr:MurR/RpiR family transcriptional regulator [Tuberibacillus sp. Marseille-P3662]